MRRLNLLLVISFTLFQCILVHSQDENFQCSPRFTIETDLSNKDCQEGEYLLQNKIHGCFPGCAEIVKEQEGDCSGEIVCPPGYNCIDDVCEIDIDSCLKYQSVIPGTDSPFYDAKWKPQCLKDGTWAPKQCKGEEANGRCFCYDKVGNRIFGQAWSTEADDMTCACSRKREELAEDPENWFVSLHCDKNGNYEPLQCSPEQCWCAEPKTGEVISPIVPESLMIHLPCYSEKLVGKQYLRQCDSHLYAQLKATRELKIHGTQNVNFQKVLCDADGSYGRLSVRNGFSNCVWGDNSLAGSWQVAVNESKGQNCNCAWDTRFFKMEGHQQQLKCQTNGNYESLQQVGGQYYCVDSDGFPKSELSDTPEDCNTKM